MIPENNNITEQKYESEVTERESTSKCFHCNGSTCNRYEKTSLYSRRTQSNMAASPAVEENNMTIRIQPWTDEQSYFSLPPPPYTPLPIPSPAYSPTDPNPFLSISSAPLISPVTPSAPLLNGFDTDPVNNPQVTTCVNNNRQRKSEVNMNIHNDFFTSTAPLKKIAKIIGLLSAFIICAIVVLLLILGKL